MEQKLAAKNKHPCFILVRPQMGENIGAAARAMWNFGLERMRVVSPRDGWPNQKAVAMASGAGRLLDEALIFPTFEEAIADQNFVFATTARPRDLIKPIYSPKDGWLVKMKSGGNINPHIHEHGWLSGSIYINVPKKMDLNSGNLVVSLDDKKKEDLENFQNSNFKIINVKTGTLCLFPASLFHYTIPFKSDEDRIVLAFDVIAN